MLTEIVEGDATHTIAKTNALTFLTFNAGLMHYRLLGVTLLRNPPFTNRRLRHMPIALRAANADIVALQEIFEERQADYLIESLRLIYPFSARRTSGGVFALHNGLLTLSKFPIIRTDFYRFRNITWSESLLGSKGVLETVVNVPSIGLICVLNVHMVSGSIDPESARLDTLRAEETREVLNLAGAAEARGEVPVLMGDFNAAPTVCPSSYNMLLAERWDDAFLVGSPPETRYPGRPNSLSFSQPLTMEASRKPAQLHPGTHPGTKRHSISGAVSGGGGLLGSEAALSSCSSMYTDGGGLSALATSFRPLRSLTGSGKVLYTHVVNSADDRLLWNGADDCSTCDSVEDVISGKLDASERRIWTWDPSNALNLLGPHAGCHGLRCDHIFLPPPETRGGLSDFAVSRSQILFHQPRVLIHSKWLTTCLIAPLSKCFRDSRRSSAPLLVTLSDHYAVRVELVRRNRPAAERDAVSKAEGDAVSRAEGDSAEETVASTREVLRPSLAIDISAADERFHPPANLATAKTNNQ
eukprot:Gregarina_sp_Pseudo_9__784@NODE_14_length_6322_cov_57_267229_g12_i0_p2_GENE_NODE_14_length_6322_cov_57_267229_g12_i0NODE_14_length_6322_cov_57_267229_g12_i0_p2_ORF_typecomplete_len527_score64_64Exo_endo_phos/PF03372_23/1_3e24_NODE_14_length_6322_cov_57_267229_g12_i06452225